MTRVSPYVGKLYRDYFTENVDDETTVADEEPQSRPPKLLVVTTVPASGAFSFRYGSRIFSKCRIVAQWWIGSDDECGEFGVWLRKLVVESKYVLATVKDVGIIGEPGSFNDPDDVSPRFQMTFDVVTKNIPN